MRERKGMCVSEGEHSLLSGSRKRIKSTLIMIVSHFNKKKTVKSLFL